MPNAKLYEVHLPKGTVYALHDLASGTIWTERGEQAARQLAKDRRLTITEEKTISHEELLVLIGHGPIRKTPTTSESAAGESHPVEPVEVAEAVAPSPQFSNHPPAPLSFPVHYHLDNDESETLDNAIVIPRPASPPGTNVFCSESQITPSTPATTTETENEKTGVRDDASSKHS